jgi:CheY-like chemotaxis protein
MVAPILIVDDTAFNIEIMQLMIEVNFPQLTCESATSGLISIDKVQKRILAGKEPYKLILMDINMPPGIDGSEACRRLRKQFGRELSDTMIVAFTAIPKEQFGNPYEKKFDAMLSKPCSLADLKDILVKAELVSR